MGNVVNKGIIEHVYFGVLQLSPAVAFLHCSIFIHPPPTQYKLSGRHCFEIKYQKTLKSPVEKQLNFV
jgi:hypothetical protein